MMMSERGKYIMKQQLEEFMTDAGCIGNCTKLRWNRRRLGLSQAEFAKKVGVSQATISTLERDETAWATLQDNTVDKILSFYSSMSSWQPERADKVIREINETSDIEEVADITAEEPTEMSKCVMLITTRRKLGMSQAELSVRVGVNEKTIRRLEKDETAWSSVRESSVDKIMSFCSNASSYQPEQLDKVIQETNKTDKTSETEEEVIMDAPAVFAQATVKPIERGLTKQDEKTLTLIDFAYEELTQAKTHDEFELAIKMIKKIVDRY